MPRVQTDVTFPHTDDVLEAIAPGRRVYVELMRDTFRHMTPDDLHNAIGNLNKSIEELEPPLLSTRLGNIVLLFTEFDLDDFRSTQHQKAARTALAAVIDHGSLPQAE